MLHITRIVNSCTLIEVDGLKLLTDPWFTERWHLHRAEPLGLVPEDLPELDVILGSNPFVNHWDRRGLRRIRGQSATVVTSHRRMERIARACGFDTTIRLRSGECVTIADLRIDAFAGGGLGPATNVYALTTPTTRILFGGEACDVTHVRRWAEVNGPVQVALLPVNGLTAFGRRLVMSATEAVEAAKAAGAHTLVPIHDAHHEDLVWRFIRRRSTARDCLSARDRIAPAMRILDLPTGRREPIHATV